MGNKGFIDDKERLFELAPVAKAPIKHQVLVCNGKSCIALGSAEVKAAFERELKARSLQYGKESKGRNPNGTVLLTDCGSIGFCAIGTAVLVYPEGIWYAQVSEEDVAQIIDEHLIQGKVVERLRLTDLESMKD